MLIKSKKFWLSFLIIFIISCTIAIFIMNKTANTQKTAQLFSEYFNNINKYTDEINEEYNVYLINNKAKAYYIIKEDNFEKGEFNELPKALSFTNSLFEKVNYQNQTYLLFYMDNIKTHQVTSYLNYCLSKIVEESILDNYQLELASLELVFPEKPMARYAFFEVTKRLRQYIIKGEELNLKTAKYYYEQYKTKGNNYSDAEYFLETYQTLNIISYSKYIGYLSISEDYNYKIVKDNALINYDYSCNYNNQIIPKYLEGDYAIVFALIAFESKDRKVLLERSYLDEIFQDVEMKKVSDDLNTLQLVKKYYTTFYDNNLNFVGEMVTKYEDENVTKIVLNVNPEGVSKIYNYVTVEKSFFGRKVQLLEVDFKIKLFETAYIHLSSGKMILDEDKMTITLLIELEDSGKVLLENQGRIEYFKSDTIEMKDVLLNYSSLENKGVVINV